MVSLVAALTVFATVDEAAISALTHAATICNPQYECGGVVRAVNGGFEASGLITSKRPFGVDLGEFYGPDVVADFHTVGYMMSLCDGYIRRFDPSQDDRDDEEVDFHSGRVIYLTIGHIVGWVPNDATRLWRVSFAEAQESRVRGGTRASTHTKDAWPAYRARTRHGRDKPAAAQQPPRQQ